MNKEERIADFLQMYKSLTDPELRDEAKRKTERAKRIEERKQDTGAYVV